MMLFLTLIFILAPPVIDESPTRATIIGVVHRVGDGSFDLEESGKGATKTYRLVEMKLDQDAYLAAHQGIPLIVTGRKGERSRMAYLLVESISVANANASAPQGEKE